MPHDEGGGDVEAAVRPKGLKNRILAVRIS